MSTVFTIVCTSTDVKFQVNVDTSWSSGDKILRKHTTSQKLMNMFQIILVCTYRSNYGIYPALSYKELVQPKQNKKYHEFSCK